jgi:hypothetical protein
LGLLTLLGFGAFVGVSFVVGLRLLLVAQRTREVPELSIGGALFAGGLGYCFYILTFVVKLFPGAMREAGYIAAIASLDVGVVFLLLGVWRVFRPGERWAAVAFASGVAALVTHLFVGVVSYDPSGARGFFTFWLFNGVAAAGYTWSACECFRYHGLLRKRARLGLADREMVHRFLLWGCAGGAALLLIGLGMLNRFLVEQGVDPSLMVAQSLLGLVSAVSIWLAFFPPAAYLRVVAGNETRP